MTGDARAQRELETAGSGAADRAAPEEETEFGRPRRRQHRLLGWAMRLVGVGCTLFGTLAFIAGYNRLRTLFVFPTYSTDPQWVIIAVVAGCLVGGAALLLAGRRLRWQGRRHSVRVLRRMEEAKWVPYVLYLRPFASDRTGAWMGHAFSRHHRVGGALVDMRSRTVEEGMVKAFRPVGRVIAVGHPEEALPLPGADRLYLPWEGWHPVVRSLIDDARMIVLATGDSDGTLWEFEQLLLRRGPQGVLLMVYSDEHGYDGFRLRADELFARHADHLRAGQASDWRPPVLPRFPRLHNPSGVKWLPVTRGYLRFDADWQPHFVLLDPTAVKGWSVNGRLRRMGREQSVPLVSRLYEGLLAAEEAADRSDALRCVTVGALAEAARAARAADGHDTAQIPVRITGAGRILDVGEVASRDRATGATLPEPRSPAGEIAPASHESSPSPSSEPPVSLPAGLEADLAHEATPAPGGGPRPIAQAGGRAPFTVEMPLFWLEERLAEVRERGATDEDVLRLEWSTRGGLRGVRHEPRPTPGDGTAPRDTGTSP